MISLQEVENCGVEVCPRALYARRTPPYEYVTNVAIHEIARQSDPSAEPLDSEELKLQYASNRPVAYGDQVDVGLRCAWLHASGVCTMELPKPEEVSDGFEPSS